MQKLLRISLVALIALPLAFIVLAPLWLCWCAVSLTLFNWPLDEWTLTMESPPRDVPMQSPWDILFGTSPATSDAISHQQPVRREPVRGGRGMQTKFDEDSNCGSSRSELAPISATVNTNTSASRRLLQQKQKLGTTAIQGIIQAQRTWALKNGLSITESPNDCHLLKGQMYSMSKRYKIREWFHLDTAACCMRCRTTQNCAYFNSIPDQAGHCFLLRINAYNDKGGPHPAKGWIGGSIFLIVPVPTPAPTGVPTTAIPTTAAPSFAPTAVPTQVPTTEGPSMAPTLPPTTGPTFVPTMGPTHTPTSNPTPDPTGGPTYAPTFAPTYAPTMPPPQFNMGRILWFWVFVTAVIGACHSPGALGTAVRLFRGDDSGPPDIVVVREMWMPAFLSTRYSLWSPSRATPFIALFVQLTNRWVWPIRAEFEPFDYAGSFEIAGLVNFGVFNCVWVIILLLWILFGTALVYLCSRTYHWSESNATQDLLAWRTPDGSYNFAYPAWPCVLAMAIVLWIVALVILAVGIWLICGDSEEQAEPEPQVEMTFSQSQAVQADRSDEFDDTWDGKGHPPGETCPCLPLPCMCFDERSTRGPRDRWVPPGSMYHGLREAGHSSRYTSSGYCQPVYESRG